MLKGITGVDHIGIDPGDTWQAFARFTRLGFTVSTPSRFFGLPVESCQVTFPGIFLSISTSFADPARADTEWIARTKPAGITELMFGTQDIHQIERELAAQNPELLKGHAQAEALRKVHAGDQVFQQKFVILVLDPSKVKGVGNIGFCQHATPEKVFRNELLAHPNGATTLSGVTFLAEHPLSLDPFYSQLLGDSAKRVSASRYGRTIGAVEVEFATAEFLRLQLPGFTRWEELRAPDLKVIRFGVEDLQRTKNYFEFMGIDHFEADGRLYVQPAEACGFLVGFERNQS